MNNVGRRSLLDSLPDNKNLLILDTIHKEEAESPTVFGIENEDAIKEQTVLQSQINCSVKVNRIWKYCTKNKWKQLNQLPVKTYPQLLESLGKKPLLLYLFLQKKNPLLFDDMSERCTQPRRRRSMRVLKKRRITTKGAVTTATATATAMSTNIIIRLFRFFLWGKSHFNRICRQGETENCHYSIVIAIYSSST